jgi:hypothetical protein
MHGNMNVKFAFCVVSYNFGVSYNQNRRFGLIRTLMAENFNNWSKLAKRFLTRP